jgi:hypothetical protein
VSHSATPPRRARRRAQLEGPVRVDAASRRGPTRRESQLSRRSVPLAVRVTTRSYWQCPESDNSVALNVRVRVRCLHQVATDSTAMVTVALSCLRVLSLSAAGWDSESAGVNTRQSRPAGSVGAGPAAWDPAAASAFQSRCPGTDPCSRRLACGPESCQ